LVAEFMIRILNDPDWGTLGSTRRITRFLDYIPSPSILD